MKILKSKRNNNTVHLKVQEDAEKVNEAMDRAFKKIVKSAKVPGFRKGKVTRGIFEKHYGKDMIIQEAVYDAVNMTYQDAIRELELKIVDYPQNLDVKEYKEGEMLEFSCDVDVEPIIKLGKYKGIKVKKDPVDIKDEQIEAEVSRLSERYAEYNEVDRAIEDGDIIRFNNTVNFEDGSPFELWSRDNSGLKIGMSTYGKDVDEAIIGMKKDEKKSFTASLPENFGNEEVAGKTMSFEVDITEVRGKTNPELTDEMVEKETNGEQKTAAEFKESVIKRLTEHAEKTSDSKVRNDVLQGVVDNVKADIPKGMVEREIDNRLYYFDQQMRQSGLSLEKYMEMAKKTKEEMREELREESVKQVKTGLVLAKLIDEESVEVTDEDLDNEVKAWGDPKIPSLEELKKNPKYNLDNLRASVEDKKACDFLVSLAKISS